MGLDLYSKIEPYLGFEEEVYTLHREFMSQIISKDLDNILDIGCGQGYFLENLSINGKSAFGIDLSAKQIEFCQEKGLENTRCMALDEVEQKFDCATAIFDVINYIPKQELEKFFKNTNKLLSNKGYFIFDVNSLFGFEEVAQGCITMDLDEKFIAVDANFEESILTTNFTLFTKEQDSLFNKEQDSIYQYYHSKESLKKLLKKTGFQIEQIKEFHLHSFDTNDKLIFICKKS